MSDAVRTSGCAQRPRHHEDRLMRLIVWNSRGAKWDNMWNNFVEPELTPAQTDDVVGLIVEAGWAPWILPGNPVGVNNIYPMEAFGDRYDEQRALLSFCCEGIRDVRRRRAFWVPWVQTLADLEAGTRSNSRCSMGMLLMPHKFTLGQAKRFVNKKKMKRPVVSVSFREGRNVEVTVMVVHLVSSANAAGELQNLTRVVRNQIPTGTIAIVVGDFNIDIMGGLPALPANWEILAPHPVVATHQGGKSLDWALVYNPSHVPIVMSSQVIQQYGTGTNNSDHSVLRFVLNW